MWARSQTSGDCSGETWRVSCSSSSDSSTPSVRLRACSRTASSSVGDAKLGKAAEDERGDHRPLPDGRCDALRGAVPDVTGGKEPDAARLEWQRVALERPAVGEATVLRHVLPGQDVAALVRQYVLAGAPLGVRTAADAKKDAVDSACLVLACGVGERHGAEPAPTRMELGQLR